MACESGPRFLRLKGPPPVRQANFEWPGAFQSARPLGSGDDGLVLLAEALDAELDLVAGAEELGWLLA